MVATKGFKYPDRELYDWVLNELHKRNINNETIGEIAYEMQHQYLPELTVEDFGKELDEVLKKREVLNILATGFALDNLADEGLLPSPLQEIIENDLGVYGVDESLSLCLSQLYGSIAVTNYGFTDKDKPGIAKDLDNSHGHVNTFADDLALALASAVIGRCGHGSKLELDDNNVDNDDFSEIEVAINDEEGDNGFLVWDLNKFANDLKETINNSRDLADSVEEEFNHNYYVDLSVRAGVNDSWELVIDLFDNQMEPVDVIFIDLEHFLNYVYSEVDSAHEFVNTAKMIADFVFAHDLYPEEGDVYSPSDVILKDYEPLEQDDEDSNNDLVSDIAQAVVEVLNAYKHYNNRKDDANE